MVYIAFEMGHTHGGFSNAQRLIDMAAEAGVDAVKFQAIDPERLISDDTLIDEFEVLVDKRTGKTEVLQQPLIKSFQDQFLKPREYEQLVAQAHGLGLEFVVTVDFIETAERLANIGVDAFKICSGDVTHLSLIRQVAKLGKTVMIDTGNSTLGEVERAADTVYSTGNNRLVIHHCPAGFPARLEEINLRVISTLKSMFDCPVAFSDHTPGWEMCIAAVALGADMVEKTVTLDRATRAPEHIVSLEPEEAKRMVKSIRDLEKALGSKRRVLTEEQLEERKKKMRSLFAKEDLLPGVKITKDNMNDCIEYRRPGDGIPACLDYLLLGRAPRCLVSKGRKLRWEDIGTLQ